MSSWLPECGRQLTLKVDTRTPVLRQYLAQQFTLPLRSPIHREEAAFGAAVFAAAAAGIYPDTARAQNALVHLT